MRRLLVKDLLWELNSAGRNALERKPENLEWIDSKAVDLTEEFVKKNKEIVAYFIRSMNRTFRPR